MTPEEVMPSGYDEEERYFHEKDLELLKKKRGADQFEDKYKYIPVRRLALFVEDSIYRGTQWAVFEPNDEALWSSLRLSVTAFLAGLAKEGAFYDYQVVCDATTTTQEDIELGVVNILVQIAPVKPAEFVVIQIQQIAGQSPS